MDRRSTRTALAAAVVVALSACFVGIDEGKLRARGGPDGGVDGDAASRDGATDGEPTGDGASGDGGGLDAATSGGLLGWWRFDGADLGEDSTGQGRRANLAGSPSQVGGRTGGGLGLDGGTSQFMEVPSLSGTSFARDAGTISLWVRSDAQGSMDLFDTNQAADATRGHLYIELAGNVSQKSFRVRCVAAGGALGCNESFQIVTAAWVHLAVAWDAQTITAYVSDEASAPAQAFSKTYVVPFSPSDQRVRLGGGLAAQLDEIRLYDRVLSASEVASVR
jgi:hypothetical protein